MFTVMMSLLNFRMWSSVVSYGKFLTNKVRLDCASAKVVEVFVSTVFAIPK